MGRWFQANKPTAAKPEPTTKVAKRIAGLGTHDFRPWIEQCLFTIGSAVTAFERHPEQTELLEEALDASRTCTLLLEELRNRLL